MVAAGGHYLVIGAGGLGCPALLGLVAAGADAITIVDHDVVEDHNLQRQVLYTVGDVGMAKAEAAALRLRARAPHLRATPLRRRVTLDTLEPLLATLPAGTIALECTDGPGLKFMVQDACLAHAIPLVVGGAQRWRGQAQAVVRGHACLRCIFEEPPPAALQESCSEVGVMGAAVGLLGFLMAHLAVSLRTGAAVAGQVWAIDTRTLVPQRLQPRPRTGCPACGAC